MTELKYIYRDSIGSVTNQQRCIKNTLTTLHMKKYSFKSISITNLET